MEQKFVITVMIAVLCAGLAGVFAYSASVAGSEKQRLQSQISALNQENTQLKSQLDQSKTTQAALQKDLDTLEAQKGTPKAKRASSPAGRRTSQPKARSRRSR